MTFVCRHLALYVHDLRAAEAFYARVFGLDPLFRESRTGEEWSALRPELGWSEADERGIGIDMVALRRDGFVLALFQGTPGKGTVVEIGIGLSAPELDEVRALLARELDVPPEGRHFQFEDPFGYRWNVKEEDVGFRSSGEIAGRWVE